ASARGHTPHDRDHRLVLRGAPNLVPDQIAGQRGPAGGVDVEHESGGAGVPAGFANARRDRLCTRDAPRWTRVEWKLARLARSDQARERDHRNTLVAARSGQVQEAVYVPERTRLRRDDFVL